jgi:hypothetical protein
MLFNRSTSEAGNRSAYPSEAYGIASPQKIGLFPERRSIPRHLENAGRFWHENGY